MTQATDLQLKLEGGDFLTDPCYYCGKPSAMRLEFRIPDGAGGGRLVHYTFCTVHVQLARPYADRVRAALEHGEEPPDPRPR
jgi:hypothetical protein